MRGMEGEGEGGAGPTAGSMGGGEEGDVGLAGFSFTRAKGSVETKE